MKNLDLLEKYVESEIAAHTHKDLCLGFFESGDEEYFNFGISVPKITEKDFFELASVSKIFTSILVCFLCDRENFSLDDSIEKFIPEVSVRGISLRELLMHTSGLSREPQSFRSIAPKNSFLNYSEELFLKDVSTFMLDEKKRGHFDYSNFGYLILGEVVKRVLGSSDFKRILSEFILEPLELIETKYNLSEYEMLRLRCGHGLDGSPVDPYLNLGPVYTSAGGLISTTREMLKFCRIFMGDTAVPSSLRESILQALEIHKSAQGIPFSSAFHIREKEGDLFYYHPGNIAGHKCSIIFSKNTQKALVYNTTSLHHVQIVWDLIA